MADASETPTEQLTPYASDAAFIEAMHSARTWVNGPVERHIRTLDTTSRSLLRRIEHNDPDCGDTLIWNVHVADPVNNVKALAYALSRNRTIETLQLEFFGNAIVHLSQHPEAVDTIADALALMLRTNETFKWLFHLYEYTPSAALTVRHLSADHRVQLAMWSNREKAKAAESGVHFNDFSSRHEDITKEGIFAPLPDEMLVAVFERAGPCAITALTGTCARMRRVARDGMVTAGAIVRRLSRRCSCSRKWSEKDSLTLAPRRAHMALVSVAKWKRTAAS